MAVINSIFNAGKGSIGNITFRSHTTKAGTRAMVASTKVTDPKNPRTAAQMEQRAKFATAVKFYKRAVKNFFRFAYEDKRSNESDYNAFMRHNIAAAVPMNKHQVDSEAYPALGSPWMLSQGSITPLAPLSEDFADTNMAWSLIADDAGGNTGLEMTIGQLSQALVNNGYEAGDIFTIVIITSKVTEEDASAYTKDAVTEVAQRVASVPSWYVGQFVIDTANTTLVQYMNHRGATPGFASFSINKNVLAVTTKADSSWLQCGAIIITRKASDTSKLLATTTYLTGNNVYNEMLSAAGTDAYIAAMEESWNVGSDDAILKGSIAGGASGTVVTAPEITGVNSSSELPATVAQITAGDHTYTLQGSNFNSEAELTENSFVITGSGMTVKSLTISNASNATLVLSCSTANTAASLYYNGKELIRWGAGVENL